MPSSASSLVLLIIHTHAHTHTQIQLYIDEDSFWLYVEAMGIDGTPDQVVQLLVEIWPLPLQLPRGLVGNH